MDLEQLLGEALCLPSNGIDYLVSQYLAITYPDKGLVEGRHGHFHPEEMARDNLCTLTPKALVHRQTMTHWMGSKKRTTWENSKNVWFEVEWEGHQLETIIMNWGEGPNRVYHYWILAETQTIARQFLMAVCEWNAQVRGEVLVFDDGCWHKDEDLFQAIKDATLDNLILQGTLKQDIYNDLVQFFASRPTYETYKIPWKRGILFVGPPGNGKTHAVKALINALGQPCLYVKSFKHQYFTEEHNIHDVFERARESSPCILVLEDLDSLLTPRNRSFFLNELDGFASNVGIVSLATTNHPERLDPSILDRPSRFDRKYHFDLPALAERQAYIEMWNMALQEDLRLSTETIAHIADLTENFSFAYLKELFLSAMMSWIATQQAGTMGTIMAGQVTGLREQMVSANTAIEPPSEGEVPPGIRMPRVIMQGRPGGPWSSSPW